MKSFSLLILCSQKRRCHTPLSRSFARYGRTEPSGPPAFNHDFVKFLFMQDHRTEKSASSTGNFHIQCKCSGNSTIASTSKGLSVCTLRIDWCNKSRVCGLRNIFLRLLVTTVKKECSTGLICATIFCHGCYFNVAANVMSTNWYAEHTLPPGRKPLVMF